jgi:hypothetical protein
MNYVAHMETCGGLLRIRNGQFLDQLSNSQLLIRFTCRLCLAAMSMNRTRTTLIIIRKSATWYNAISSHHSAGNVAKKTAHRVTWKWPLCWNEWQATGDRWNFNEGFKQVTEGCGGCCNCPWRTGNANTTARGQFATNSHQTAVLTEITQTSHWRCSTWS